MYLIVYDKIKENGKETKFEINSLFYNVKKVLCLK